MRSCVGCSLADGCWRRWGNDEFGDGVCPHGIPVEVRKELFEL